MTKIILDANSRVLAVCVGDPVDLGRGFIFYPATNATYSGASIAEVEAVPDDAVIEPTTYTYSADAGFVEIGGRDLTFGEFRQLCYVALGDVDAPDGTDQEKQLAGLSRFGEIVMGVESGATTSTGKAILEAYTGAKSADHGFQYTDTVNFLVMIGGLLNEGELTAITTLWKKKYQ